MRSHLEVAALFALSVVLSGHADAFTTVDDQVGTLGTTIRAFSVTDAIEGSYYDSAGSHGIVDVNRSFTMVNDLSTAPGDPYQNYLNSAGKATTWHANVVKPRNCAGVINPSNIGIGWRQRITSHAEDAIRIVRSGRAGSAVVLACYFSRIVHVHQT